MPKGLPRSLAHSDQALDLVERVLSLDNVITVTAAAGGGTENKGAGSVKLEDLPTGRLLVLATDAQAVSFGGPGDSSDLDDAWQGDFSVGSTADADADLSSPSTDSDLLGSQALGAATAEVSPEVTASNLTAQLVDNSAGDAGVNLNVLVDAANLTDGESVDLRATGTLVVVYILLGAND